MKKIYIVIILAIIGLKANAQYTILLNFDSANGSNPYGSLIYDGTYLYGMTSLGGTYNDGTIFKIKPDGSNYAKLLDFAGATNGKSPAGSLISDSNFLYGMTGEGGIHGAGTIFKIKPDGSNYVKLLDFNGTNGNGATGSLIYDGTFLYGMTGIGGAYDDGTIFKIMPDGSSYVKLLDFNDTNGMRPYGSLIYDGTFLYGMTSNGDTTGMGVGFGTAFKIKPDGSNYVRLIYFSFTNGGTPYGSLISDGTFLYGMTSAGSDANDNGTIFKIKPDGSNYVELLDFNDTNGSYPFFGSLIADSAFLYGMTERGGIHNVGAIFKIKPDGSNYVKLLDFNNTNGNSPAGSLISDGTFLYGMTKIGGANADGVVFKLAIQGAGIKEINENNSIVVYPNPTSNTLIIESPQKAVIEITNIQGQLIKVIPTNAIKTNINVSSFPSGVYIVQVKSDKVYKVGKFVKE
ncbi:MAG: choice-of-anchor tandem repeat GloVer-containing protein [Bacteroidales bacterium]|jgi:uncharacterized repeat protein (TIGR03803 family)